MSIKLIADETSTHCNFVYDIDGYPNFDLILAHLGIGWDAEEKLIRYTEDTLPSELKQIHDSFDDGFSVLIKRVFHFKQTDLVDSLSTPEYTMAFRFAEIEDIDGEPYWRVQKRILNCDHDVFISAETKLKIEYFAIGTNRRISAFAKISQLITEQSRIVIGGEATDAMPWEDFAALLKNFPTRAWLDRYESLQISRLVSEYMTPKEDYEANFLVTKRRIERRAENLRAGDKPKSGASPRKDSARIGTSYINACRYESLIQVSDTLETALKDKKRLDESYWQEEILSVLPAIYPQYVAVLREAVLPERISKHGKKRDRRLDHLLIDASGNVDILEIKQPFGKNSIIMKRAYRDNYIPAHELTGGISQIEKYIFYLNHLGLDGEEKFSDACKEKLSKGGVNLPDNFRLKFLNPHGMLLIGYCNFTENEQRDFDLIRRQYAHVTDILTYNDLLERVKRIITMTE